MFPAEKTTDARGAGHPCAGLVRVEWEPMTGALETRRGRVGRKDGTVAAVVKSPLRSRAWPLLAALVMALAFIGVAHAAPPPPAPVKPTAVKPTAVKPTAVTPKAAQPPPPPPAAAAAPAKGATPPAPAPGTHADPCT